MTVAKDMAYPCQSRWDSGNESMDLYEDNRGLTKREYFAAAALTGLLSGKLAFEGFPTQEAVKIADLLISQLNDGENE